MPETREQRVKRLMQIKIDLDETIRNKPNDPPHILFKTIDVILYLTFFKKNPKLNPRKGIRIDPPLPYRGKLEEDINKILKDMDAGRIYYYEQTRILSYDPFFGWRKISNLY